MLDRKKKIMVIPPPASGHLNPVCGVINELCKNKNLEVIFYSYEQYRGLVEKTGAQFRAYSSLTFDSVPKKPITETKIVFGEMLNQMITLSYDLLPQLIGEFEKDQFDMIIYDGIFLPSKYLIEIIKMRHSKGDTMVKKMPKTVMFVPNFPICGKMVAAIREDTKEDAWSVLAILNAFKRQFSLSWTYGISVYNPIKVFTAHNDKINIVAVIPELQPYRDDFDETYKFVGPCISEEARSIEIKNDDELKALLTQFDTKKTDLKLVYMSLGTVFNANFFIYENVIDALKKFDKRPNNKFTFSQLRFIISVGEQGFKHFNDRIASGEFTLPASFLLRPKVPQLEVLKRADLFITHCGMNSTTETIKFAVPIVAIPIDADQPVNARRICDELSFGIQLDPLNMSASQIVEAVDHVLSDAKYKKNIDEMSKTMDKYNGAVEGAKLILDFLNQNN